MLTKDYLFSIFYCVDDVLYWKNGKIAGCDNGKGYLKVNINGKKYFNHHIIWCMYYGHWPLGIIDHIDRNSMNNNILNLREITRRLNRFNSKLNTNNRTGVTGVSLNTVKGYEVYISVKENHRKYVGFSCDFEEAVFLRFAAEQCVGYYDKECKSPAYLFLKNKEYIL